MKVHDCDLNVNVCGEGNCIVLLHGWGQSQKQMAFIQEALAKQYCVVNLDLAGFGESEEPPFAWSMEQYSDVLYDLLKELHCEMPLLIAHSFGARIAFHYAYKYPCSGLILTGAAGIKPPRNIHYYLKVYTYKLLKRFLKGKQMGSDDYQKATAKMKAVLVQCVNEDITPLLSHIKIPTLLIWGNQDQVTPPWMGKKMAKLMPNAHYIPIQGGHFAYLNNEVFINIVDAYVKEAFL